MGQGRQSKAMAKKVRPPLPSYMMIITLMTAVAVAGAVATMMMQPMRHFR